MGFEDGRGCAGGLAGVHPEGTIPNQPSSVPEPSVRIQIPSPLLVPCPACQHSPPHSVAHPVRTGPHLSLVDNHRPSALLAKCSPCTFPFQADDTDTVIATLLYFVHPSVIIRQFHAEHVVCLCITSKGTLAFKKLSAMLSSLLVCASPQIGDNDAYKNSDAELSACLCTPQVDPVTAEMLKAMNLTSTLSVVTVQAVG